MQEKEPIFESLGHKFYAVADQVAAMPVCREKAYLMALTAFEYNLSKEDFIKFALGAKDLMDKDVDRAKYLLQVLVDYMAMDLSRKALFGVSAHLVLVDDEKADKLTSEHLKIKQYCFENDSACANFFLESSIHILQSTGALSNDTPHLDYFKRKEVNVIEQIFSKSLQSLL